MNETTTHNWNLLLEEFDHSGLSARAFALSKDIKPASFYWQVRKRANHSGKKAIKNSAEPVFVPVITEGNPTNRLSKISLSIGEISINIEPGFNPQLLCEVVQVLRASC